MAQTTPFYFLILEYSIMAKIIITFAEVRASANLISTILETAAENDFGKNKSKMATKREELRDMSDEGIRQFYTKNMTEAEAKLIMVGQSDITIEVPEKFIVGYLGKTEKFVIKAAPILVAMASLVKSFAMVASSFTSDITKLVKETFGGAEEESPAKDEEAAETEAE